MFYPTTVIHLKNGHAEKNAKIKLPLKNVFVAALLPFFLRLLTTRRGIGAGGVSAEFFDGEHHRIKQMLSRTPHLVTLSPDAKGLALCAAKKSNLLSRKGWPALSYLPFPKRMGRSR